MFDFSSWGGLEIIFEFEGTSGGPCRELIFEFESPPVNAACALLLLFVMAKAVAEAAFQLGTGLQEPGQGVHWRDKSWFPQNHYK